MKKYVYLFLLLGSKMVFCSEKISTDWVVNLEEDSQNSNSPKAQEKNKAEIQAAIPLDSQKKQEEQRAIKEKEDTNIPALHFLQRMGYPQVLLKHNNTNKGEKK